MCVCVCNCSFACCHGLVKNVTAFLGRLWYSFHWSLNKAHATKFFPNNDHIQMVKRCPLFFCSGLPWMVCDTFGLEDCALLLFFSWRVAHCLPPQDATTATTVTTTERQQEKICQDLALNLLTPGPESKFYFTFLMIVYNLISTHWLGSVDSEPVENVRFFFAVAVKRLSLMWFQISSLTRLFVLSQDWSITLVASPWPVVTSPLIPIPMMMWMVTFNFHTLPLPQKTSSSRSESFMCYKI